MPKIAENAQNERCNAHAQILLISIFLCKFSLPWRKIIAVAAGAGARAMAAAIALMKTKDLSCELEVGAKVVNAPLHWFSGDCVCVWACVCVYFVLVKEICFGIIAKADFVRAECSKCATITRTTLCEICYNNSNNNSSIAELINDNRVTIANQCSAYYMCVYVCVAVTNGIARGWKIVNHVTWKAVALN